MDVYADVLTILTGPTTDTYTRVSDGQGHDDDSGTMPSPDVVTTSTYTSPINENSLTLTNHSAIGGGVYSLVGSLLDPAPAFKQVFTYNTYGSTQQVGSEIVANSAPQDQSTTFIPEEGTGGDMPPITYTSSHWVDLGPASSDSTDIEAKITAAQAQIDSDNIDLTQLNKRLNHDDNILKNANAGRDEALIAEDYGAAKIALSLSPEGVFVSAVLAGINYAASGHSEEDTASFILGSNAALGDANVTSAEASGLAESLFSKIGATKALARFSANAAKTASVGYDLYNDIFNNDAVNMKTKFSQEIKNTKDDIDATNVEITSTQDDIVNQQSIIDELSQQLSQNDSGSSPIDPELHAVANQPSSFTKNRGKQFVLGTNGTSYISYFQDRGANHDTLAVPLSNFTDVTDALRHTRNSDIGVDVTPVFHPGTTGVGRVI